MKVVDSLDKKTSKASDKPKKSLIKGGQISKNITQPVIVFFIAFVAYLFLLAMNSIIPFGENYLLLSDLKAQFAPYIILFKNHIREIDWSNFWSSFTYTSVLGGGNNFMATFGYYMLSPVNWIIFLFKDYQIDYAIVVIIGIKISLAASFMCLFLRRRVEDKSSKWPFILGITYAFTSYTLVFLFAIIWLDGYALLPLLLYFIEKFIDERKKSGLVVTLLLLFIANLYISYMVGVFSFLYLVGRLITKCYIEESMKVKEAISIAVRFVLSAIVCILTLGVLILPIGLGILGNRDVLDNSSETATVSFKGIRILDQIFLGNIGDFNEVLSNNMPFIFVSLLFTLLILTFFITKVFSRKQKVFYGIILILIYASFNISALDLAWQAFDNPNWFSHRQSFVFMPVFYIIALMTIEKVKEIDKKSILSASLVLVALLLVAQSFGEISKNGIVFLVNLGFIGGYTLLLLGLKREKWPEQLKNMQRLSCFILAIVLVAECTGINSAMSGNISSYMCYGSSEQYQTELQLLQASVDAVGENNFRMAYDDSFYNKDVLLTPGEEAGIYGNFRTINIFDSSSNKNFGRFMKQLGHATSFNYFYSCYGYIAPPTDAFFSIPVVFASENSYSGKVLNDLTAGDSEVITYFTGKILPIGFAADSNCYNFNFYQLEKKELLKDYFQFQNDWYQSMFSESFKEDFYRSYRVRKNTDITLYNAEYFPAEKIDYSLPASVTTDPTSNDSSERPYQVRNTIVRNGSSLPIVLSIKYTVQNTGEQYFSVVADRLLDEMTLYVNGKEYNYYNPESYYSRIYRIGYFEEGDEIEVVIESDKDVYSYQDFYFATIDSDLFYEQLGKIDQSKVVVDKYDNGHLEFTTNLSDNDVLLTSIPYEDGWTCYVDGVETDIKVYQNALISVDVGTGVHKVELEYVAPGIKAGLIVSAIGVISMIALFVLDNRKKK